MTTDAIQSLLNQAQQRAQPLSLPYAGVVTPQEAYQLSTQSDQVTIVDVRSCAEIELVGRVPNAQTLEWAFYPGMVANPEFAHQLQANVPKTHIVIFMCRTGGRSHNAAILAHQLGYAQAYNMSEGFEGEMNATKQRTTINGWRFAGLPWTHA